MPELTQLITDQSTSPIKSHQQLIFFVFSPKSLKSSPFPFFQHSSPELYEFVNGFAPGSGPDGNKCLDTSQQSHVRGQYNSHLVTFFQIVHEFKHYISEPDTIVINFILYTKKVRISLSKFESKVFNIIAFCYGLQDTGNCII